MIRAGRKFKAVNGLFQALELCKLDKQKRLVNDTMILFTKMVTLIEPVLNVRSTRISGSAVRIPYKLHPNFSLACGIRWFFRIARKRQRPIFKAISAEFRNLVEEKANSNAAIYRNSIADEAFRNRTVLRHKR